MSGEILVVPKNAQGHLFPCMELCKHLLSRYSVNITLLVDSDVTSSVPSSLLRSPLFRILDVKSGSVPLSPESDPQGLPLDRQQHGVVMARAIEAFLARYGPDSARPACAIIDHIMYRAQEVFAKFGIPTVTFITSGACWAAVQHAAWVVRPDDMRPGEVRALPGLPEGMVLSYSDLKQRRHWMTGPPRGGGSGGRGGGPPEEMGGGKPKMMGGPPFPGGPAPWVEEVKSAAAILVNTCDDLERPFMDYMANLTGKPIWGVGPLLPDQYWQSAESLLRERGIRPNRESNYTDDEIISWLDKQPPRSVILVSFGSEVSPSPEEYPELASALEESARPFIWVIQRKSSPGKPDSTYFPHGLDSRVGERGLVVHGWAPQLLILSHPSTGGFVSHCGWNSTVEAIVRGVPILAWPIRGDQYYNAKLVVNYLRVGTMVSEAYPEGMVKKGNVGKGIDKVIGDEDIRRRSLELRGKFEKGFPESSVASMESFVRDLILRKC
ncbi:anthocyanin 3'-O-beta-glucosyltransferase-like [Punica granatum]|uniref:Glycosyltransferase n=1 Tax=Punica granatum TaxID=22663 RepID=A0A6P8DFT3_PUNGR|nr:anthocyanin 3'-O-beta-glucosyltransferase-like [Punica granatum]